MISILGFQISIIDLVGAVIGLFYIVSEYRAGRWFWHLCLLMSAFYIVIDYTSGYFANGTICVYNFLMSFYGLLVWRGVLQSKDKKEKPFGSCPSRYVWWIIAAIVLLTLFLWWLLDVLGESQYPLLDGFSSALSIVAMWMLAQKWWQQWFCWIIVEPVMVVLFWVSGNYASAVLYVVYEIFCVMGLVSWRRKYLNEKQ